MTQHLIGNSGHESDEQIRLSRLVPGLAIIAAKTWWHSVKWSVEVATTTGNRVLKEIQEGQSPTEITQAASAELRSAAQKALGIVSPVNPKTQIHNHADPEVQTTSDAAELRKRGAELLRRSADINDIHDTHPAYARILNELAPDEARILRYLAAYGPQPTVDVRTNRPFDIGSEMIAEGLSMIGELAGCRHTNRTNAYLNNLFRLGLLWFSKESVEQERYQVVEVQPAVIEAMKLAGRAPKTVRRSVHLTPFGEDFCHAVIPSEPTNTVL
ncbi:MAG: DUF4393 domain-containing protein [Mycobacteriaceae bacterium]